ncbi:MAG: BMP family ABC transporter substrate-binding protein [Spirochaetales bacterium]|nr:BMP family ABC transporter substrate-binding protein [Spirochaetales bacterium]
MKKVPVILIIVLLLLSLMGCEFILELLGLGKPKVAKPVFAPPPGEYTSVQQITIACEDSEAIIFYTLDGTDPTAASTKYEGPFELSSSATIKALAIVTGKTDSDIAIGHYILTITEENQVSTPTFDPAPGTYDSDQQVTISCTTPDATIHYTTDGNDPTAASAVYSTAINIAGDGTSVTLKTLAVKDGMTDSAIATGTYAIEYAVIQVVMLYSGALDDGGYNEMANTALEQAAIDYDIVYEAVASDDINYEAELAALAEDGADLIFGIGFMFGTPTAPMANVAGSYPGTTFVAIDGLVEDTAPENAFGVMFKLHESGFLAGFTAASVSDSQALGVVLGADIPQTRAYLAGFYAGAKTIRPSCTVLSTVVGTFADFAAGQAAAEDFINNSGVDVIFHAAGETGSGALAAADAAEVFGIGVDMDQNPLYPDTVITSAIKYIDIAVSIVVDEFLAGPPEGGTTYYLGLSEGAVGLAPYRSFPVGFDVAALESEVNAAATDIIDGVLFVPSSMDEVARIGVVTDFTGSAASFGVDIYRAAKLCTFSMNYSGGFQGKFMALEVEDDVSESTVSEVAAQRMVDQGVLGVIGHTTSATTEAGLIAAYTDAALPVISPTATYPHLTRSGLYPNFYRTIHDELDRARYAAIFGDDLDGTRSDGDSFAILHDTERQYYIDFADFIESVVVNPDIVNGTVVQNEGIDFVAAAGDFSAVTGALGTLGAEVVLYAGGGANGAELLNAIRAASIDIAFIVATSFENNEFLSNVPANPPDVYVVEYLPESEVLEGQDQITEYIDTYGEDPKPHFLKAYAATQALLFAIDLAGWSIDPADIFFALENNDFDTVIGTINFDEAGDVGGDNAGFCVYNIVDGDYQLLP